MRPVNFDIHKFIDEAMVKKDRYVSIYFGENGTSVSVYPLTDDEEEERCKCLNGLCNYLNEKLGIDTATIINDGVSFKESED